jgi:hypothetical protein
MRSKKVLVIVAALVACLAVGSVTVASAHILKKKKFPATISLTVTKTQNPNPPYSQGAGSFSGHVGSGGPKGCRSGRSVTVTGPVSGAGTTNGNGDYFIPTSVAPPAGSYTATVAKRVIVKKKKHKKFICKAASVTVTFPG